MRGDTERGGGKSGAGSEGGAEAVQECLLEREKSFNKLFGILLYVLGIGDTKLKML